MQGLKEQKKSRIESKNKASEDEYKDNKIILDTPDDLLNLTSEQINNINVFNLSGELYKKIYEEAVLIEEGKKNQKITHQQKSKKPTGQEINEQNKKLNRNKSLPKKKNQTKEDKNITKKNNNIAPINNISNLSRVKEDSKSPEHTNNNQKSINNNIDKNNNENINKNNNEKGNKNKIKHAHNDKNSHNIQKNNLTKIDNNENENKAFYSNEKFPLKKIIFSIRYDTTFGEDIGILGSIDKLGKWDQKGIMYLKWNKGNIWTGEIDVDDKKLEDFEFKFVIALNGELKIWESGFNNKVLFQKLFEVIKEKNKGRFNKYEYMYNLEKEELTLKCKWNK